MPLLFESLLLLLVTFAIGLFIGRLVFKRS